MIDLQRVVTLGVSAGSLVAHGSGVEMKLSAAPILWGITAFLLFPGCSQEENFPPPRQKQKVVRPTGIAVAEKERPASDLDEKKADPGEQTATRPTETPPKETSSKETSSKETSPKETPPKETPEERALENKPSAIKEEPEGKGGQGYYVVRDGDTLSTIAGREEVYKDPLKWPILFRFNLHELGRLSEAPDFAERKLSSGTRLKIAMPRESKVSEKEAAASWVANVMSSRSNEEIVPLAVRLVRMGLPVYITRAKVKGQEWMRLRVGFFSDKAEAQEMGKKIKEAVQVEDPWILKVGKEEYDEFVRFLERDSGS